MSRNQSHVAPLCEERSLDQIRPGSLVCELNQVAIQPSGVLARIAGTPQPRLHELLPWHWGHERRISLARRCIATGLPSRLAPWRLNSLQKSEDTPMASIFWLSGMGVRQPTINNCQRNLRIYLACIVERMRSENSCAVFVMFTAKEERPKSNHSITVFKCETPQSIRSKPTKTLRLIGSASHPGT